MRIAVRRWMLVMLVAVSLPAQATLLSRLGGAAAYDDVLNITWLTDANYCATNLTDPACAVHDSGGDGLMTWYEASDWAADLVFAGFDDWRLPYASVAAGAGPITTLPRGFPCTGDDTAADELACRDIEMAYMFYYNMGGNQAENKTGDQTVGVGVDAVTLTNVQSFYWSGTEVDSVNVWRSRFDVGNLSDDGKGIIFSGWAVRSGDVAVPAPATLLLMALSLLGMGYARRRRH